MTNKVLIATTNQLFPRIGRQVFIEGKSVALFRLTDNQIVALEDYCPLTQAPILEGIVSGEYLYEPMRDYKISLLTGEIQAPDEGQVKTYPIVLEGKNIYLVA